MTGPGLLFWTGMIVVDAVPELTVLISIASGFNGVGASTGALASVMDGFKTSASAVEFNLKSTLVEKTLIFYCSLIAAKNFAFNSDFFHL